MTHYILIVSLFNVLPIHQTRVVYINGAFEHLTRKVACYKCTCYQKCSSKLDILRGYITHPKEFTHSNIVHVCSYILSVYNNSVSSSDELAKSLRCWMTYYVERSIDVFSIGLFQLLQQGQLSRDINHIVT